ncbi:hypothetical protein ACNP23_005135 [Escherichia coli]|uniref:hypothetical protein n=1 Tax=Escherichia coli TaxID=562 RepID=UPI002FC6C1D7
MNETELKAVILTLLVDARHVQQIAPNAGTEARIKFAEKVLQQNSEKSESDIRNINSNITDRSGAADNEFIRDLEKLLGCRQVKLLFLVPLIHRKVGEVLKENGIPKEYARDAMEYSLELVRINPDLDWLDEHLEFQKGASCED